MKQALRHPVVTFGVPVLAGLAFPAVAKDSYPLLDVLFSTSDTVIGQPFAYPEGVARI